ncbi:MAG: hypothetical protein LBH98_03210 [Chitinispirillales bacterium]|jgi:hypothetical protein|nr:hypothetical protein [Chitinispirillales bacterium]
MRRQFFIVFCFAVLAFSREKIRPEYDFKDSSFSLTYRIDIPKLSDDEILSILFNFEKVREYSAKTNVKITLIEENTKTNRILYEYNYSVAKLGVEMFREKFQEQKMVVFRMEKYNRTAKIIPDVLSAGGSYKINNDCILYKQQTVMNKKINAIYTMLIKRDVQGYLKEIMKYIDDQALKTNSI